METTGKTNDQAEETKNVTNPKRNKATHLQAHRKRRWHNVVTALAVVVVFCTTYALILPAITATKKDIDGNVVYCGLDEHTHTDDCYTITQTTTKTQVCDPTEGGTVTVAHTHDAECYDDAGELVCALPEVEAHEHSEACYDESGTLTCTEAETVAHQHTSDCFSEETTEEKTLTCELEEHTHTDECYVDPEAEEDPEAEAEEGDEDESDEDGIMLLASNDVDQSDYIYNITASDGVSIKVTLPYYEGRPSKDSLSVTVERVDTSSTDASAMRSAVTAVLGKNTIGTVNDGREPKSIVSGGLESYYKLVWKVDDVETSLASAAAPKATVTGVTSQSAQQGGVVEAYVLTASGSGYTAGSAVDVALNGVNLTLNSTGSFAIVEVQTSGAFWKRVDSTTEIDENPNATYLIISANGSFRITKDMTGSYYYGVANEVRPIKGNEGYYQILDVPSGTRVANATSVEGLPSTSIAGTGPKSLWTITKNSYGNTYTIKHSSSSTTLGSSITLARQTDGSNTWTVRSSSGYLYNDGSGSTNTLSGYTSAANSFNTFKWSSTTSTADDAYNMLIFRYVGGTLSIPDDASAVNALTDGTLAMANNNNTVDSVTQKTALTGEKTLTGTLEGLTLDYASDTATANLEDDLRKASGYNYSTQKDNDGKLYTDKSVVYMDDDYNAITDSDYTDTDFSVTLSALGQEWQTAETNTFSTPIDVVILFDTSNSMNYTDTNTYTSTSSSQWTSYSNRRWVRAIDSINSTIQTIMNANSNNRVGVVAFSNGAVDVMDLDHYTTTNGQYLTYTATGSNGSTRWKYQDTSSDCYTIRTSSNLKNSSGNQAKQVTCNDSTKLWGATFTQAGLQQAYNMFARATTTFTYTGSDGTTYTGSRQPLIIMVTDGDPTISTYNYTNPQQGPYYGSGGSSRGVHGFYTDISAFYFKNMTSIHYERKAFFYTIGLDVTSNYEKAVLDPSEENVSKLGSNVSNGSAVSSYYWDDEGAALRDLLKNTGVGIGTTAGTFLSNVGSNTFNNLYGQTNTYLRGMTNLFGSYMTIAGTSTLTSFNDGAFFGTMSTSTLEQYLKQIVDTVQITNNYDFDLLKGNVEFSDSIGSGMEIKGTPVLRVFGTNYAADSNPKTTTSIDNGNTVKTTTYTWKNAGPTGNGQIPRPEDPNTKSYGVDRSNLDVTGVTATVTTTTDGNGNVVSQTMKWSIPEEALATFYPDLHSQFYYEELPMRLIYRVGLSTAEQTAVAGSSTAVNKTYYTNTWTSGSGTTTVTFKPTSDNPYYAGQSSKYSSDSVQQSESKVTDANATSTASTVWTERKTTSGSETTVTQTLGNNGKLTLTGDAKNSVTKKWNDGNTTGKPAVTVELYKKTTRTVTQAVRSDTVEVVSWDSIKASFSAEELAKVSDSAIAWSSNLTLSSSNSWTQALGDLSSGSSDTKTVELTATDGTKYKVAYTESDTWYLHEAKVTGDDGTTYAPTYYVKGSSSSNGTLVNTQTLSVTNSEGKTAEYDLAQVGSDCGQVYIVNAVSYTLPKTGGIGTHWFTWGGAALVALAGLMYTRRRTTPVGIRRRR